MRWQMFATRGVLVMSNIFLSVSFVYLASLDADCVNFGPDFDADPRNFTYVEPCPNTVYGFKPGSLVANIAVITGLLSAFLMPLIGAVVDYTPHRRAVGIWSAVMIVAIQIIQIGTVESTWFPMLILQGIAGFMYQIQVVAAFAYLPEVASLVGQEKMAVCKYTYLYGACMGDHFSSTHRIEELTCGYSFQTLPNYQHFHFWHRRCFW